MLIEQLKNYLAQDRFNNLSLDYKKNLAKEFLQYFILNFIYNNQEYNQLIFTGGTCLRICFDLPRLSEDLDFDSVLPLNKEKLADDLINFLKTDCQCAEVESVIKGQYEKIYLKFDILRAIGLASGVESNKLYVKVEISPEATGGIYNKEVSLVSKSNFSFLVSRYSMPDLMAGKIGAIYTRLFFKGRQNQIEFKGRDYFDLIWYMNQGTVPNMPRLNKMLVLGNYGKQFIGVSEMMSALGNKIDGLNLNHLEMVLLPFVNDMNFLDAWLKNFKQLFADLSKKYV